MYRDRKFHLIYVQFNSPIVCHHCFPVPHRQSESRIEKVSKEESGGRMVSSVDPENFSFVTLHLITRFSTTREPEI